MSDFACFVEYFSVLEGPGCQILVIFGPWGRFELPGVEFGAQNRAEVYFLGFKLGWCLDAFGNASRVALLSHLALETVAQATKATINRPGGRC